MPRKYTTLLGSHYCLERIGTYERRTLGKMYPYPQTTTYIRGEWAFART